MRLRLLGKVQVDEFSFEELRGTFEKIDQQLAMIDSEIEASEAGGRGS